MHETSLDEWVGFGGQALELVRSLWAPVSIIYFPPLSFLVMASGPDSSELAGNLAADARRCEGGFS